MLQVGNETDLDDFAAPLGTNIWGDDGNDSHPKKRPRDERTFYHGSGNESMRAPL